MESQILSQKSRRRQSRVRVSLAMAKTALKGGGKKV
jgi:hypothetical protein